MNGTARMLSLLLGVLIAAGAIPEVRAQAQRPEIVLAQGEPGIFRFLFRGRGREVPMPRELVPLREVPREQTRPRRQRDAARPRRERRNRPAAPAVPEVAAVEKAADAKRVLVVGDFIAGALAKGLTEAYSENANVVVIGASNGSSGLVRDDFYNWPVELPAIVEAQKPDAILVLVGANDRQAIRTETGSHVLGSDGWRNAYAGRVSALADALKATGKPILWTGLAPVSSSSMSRDYSAINGIAREQLEGRGLRFIETWNGFADEEGRFVAAGPDVSGQTVQLRDSDGLNFTRAGQRKLAYFVERELNELLGGATPVLANATATAATGVTAPGEKVPQIGPMVPIEALTAGGDVLSGDRLSGAANNAAPMGATAAPAIIKRLAGEDDAAAPAGRADNYVWPAGAGAAPP